MHPCAVGAVRTRAAFCCAASISRHVLSERHVLCIPPTTPFHRKDSLAILLRVLAHPQLCRLLKPCWVVLKLLRYTCFDRIIWLRRSEYRPHQLQHIGNLIRRLPFIRLEHSQTHCSSLIVANIGMVDLGAKGEGWWFEWVLFWESNLDVKFAALGGTSLVSTCGWYRSTLLMYVRYPPNRPNLKGRP